VAFIFREEQYKTAEEREAMPEDRKNIAELIIAKQRNGPTGTVDLRFTPSSMRFDNLIASRDKAFLTSTCHGR
jgi:replicative DNA helicase